MSVMSLEEPVELKFRLYDGTDIGPNKYAPATTVANIKESILSHWPKGVYELTRSPPINVNQIILIRLKNRMVRKSINDLKLINAGKILENSKTLADSRVPLGEIPGCVITMHVVIRAAANDKASEKQQSETPKNPQCCCTIL